MSKKLFPIFSALLIAVFILSACGTAATTAPVEQKTEAPVVATTEVMTEAAPTVKGKVVLWHSKNPEETNSLNDIIAGFKAMYPDVTLDVLFVPDADLRNKFETAVASGSGPTLLIGPADWGPASFDAKLVADISKMLTSDLVPTINEAAFASVQYKDAVVGLPINIKGVVLFRNKTIIAEPAKTLDELIAASKAATKGDVVGANLEVGFFFSAGHLVGVGGKLMDPATGVPMFNDAMGVEWMNTLKKFKDAGIVENYTDNDLNLFKAGKVGYVIDGSWNAKALGEAIGADNLAIDVWPTPLNGFVQNDNIYLTTAATGDDAVASEKFMEYFLSPEAQTIWSDVGTKDKPMAAGIPVIKGLDIKDPVAKASAAALGAGVPFPVIPQM
ncbi:MAG: extracellular solute-binding protein, partial [Anaerolineaceae bacterium]|nr:extracellular solute-binding protein [Anaerolineaceae bacterium]